MDVQDELLSTFHRDRAPAVSLHNFIAEPREIDHLHAKMAFSSSAESRFFNNLESLFEIMNYSISLDGSVISFGFAPEMLTHSMHTY
ncbi:Elongator complex protein [Trichinella pseudospiralis]